MKYTSLTVLAVTSRDRGELFGSADHAILHGPQEGQGDIVLDDVLLLTSPAGIAELDLALARQQVSQAYGQANELHILADGEHERQIVAGAMGRLRLPLSPATTKVFVRGNDVDEPWLIAD